MSHDFERRDVVISPPPARATATGHAAAVTISTPYWLYWLDIAVEQLERAASARADAVQLRKAGDEIGIAIVEETQAGMIAAVASAACVESFYKTVASLSGYDLSGGGKTAKVAFDVLRQSFNVEEGGLERRLRTLFDDRNEAIHSGETDKPTAPHPVGVNTGSGNAFFTAKRAVEAVLLAAGLIVECIGSTRAGDEFVQLKTRLTAHASHVHERAERARRVSIPT